MELSERVRAILEKEYGLRPKAGPAAARGRRLSPDARIGASVHFGEDVIVEDAVEIEDGCSIGNRVTLRNCKLGRNVRVEDNCIIGYTTLTGGFSHKLDGYDRPSPAVIGEGTLIRTGCVVYQSVSIGTGCWINHGVLLREHTQIGDQTCIGSMSDSEGYNRIGNHVLIHSQVHLCARMEIEDYVFVAPLTVFTNGAPMGYCRDTGGTEEGPVVRFGAQIAVNVVVLPRVVIGYEALIGASAVVAKDVPALSIVMGVPGKVLGRVPEHLRMPEDLRRRYYGGLLDPEEPAQK